MDMEQLVIMLFVPGISLVVVGVAMAVWYFYPIVFEQNWIREARAVHAEWVATGRIEGERRIEESHFLTEVRRSGAAPYIPDLGGAFLALDRVALLPPRDARAEALHAGYIKRQGFRLTLWITKAAKGDGGRVSRRRIRLDGARPALRHGRHGLSRRPARRARRRDRADQPRRHRPVGARTPVARPQRGAQPALPALAIARRRTVA